MKMTNKFINGLEEELNYTVTENGAVAYKSSLSGVLDAFGTLGSVRNWPEADIIKVYNLAYHEDKELATKLLFWLRDVRGGAGERKTFRILLTYCAEHYPKMVLANLDNIPYYGRWDDLLCLLDVDNTKYYVSSWLYRKLTDDVMAYSEDRYNDITLLAKWLPSINTSSAETRRYANFLIKDWEMSPKQYRKTLSVLRKTIDVTEVKMSANRWEDIKYQNVPSKAAMNYAEAFNRHDKIGYDKYLNDLAEGKAKINAGALFPADIVSRALIEKVNSLNDRVLTAQWKALPNYFEGKEEFGLAVVDVSGSMYGKPIEVAISLGMYLADKAVGPYSGKFITFSARPELQSVVGNTITEKVKNLSNAYWDMNTNIEAVFRLILDVAVKNKLKQDEIPTKLYIISDMQFDEATSKRVNYPIIPIDKETLVETMQHEYEKYGYSLPALVYWNVRSSDCGMFQQKVGDSNWCMVSGYSSSLFKSVMDGTEYVEEINEKGETVVKQRIDPIAVMLNTLNSERYSKVVV